MISTSTPRIPDEDDPAGIVAALPTGSWLALSHGITDFHPVEVTAPTAAAYDTAPVPLVLRSRAAIEAFFDGFALEDPGLVQAVGTAGRRVSVQPECAAGRPKYPAQTYDARRDLS
jgi:hypothetical protein